MMTEGRIRTLLACRKPRSRLIGVYESSLAAASWHCFRAFNGTRSFASVTCHQSYAKNWFRKRSPALLDFVRLVERDKEHVAYAVRSPVMPWRRSDRDAESEADLMCGTCHRSIAESAKGC